MTDYYVDPSADFVAGRDGSDSTAEVLTGPGGLQIAMRGGGGAAGEFKAGGLVAGDRLFIKGGAAGVDCDLSRLVIIETGQDSSHWEIGDTVTDNYVGAEVWTGKVVQEYDNVATGLSSTAHVLVQVDDPYDYDIVNNSKTSGIINSTKAETTTIASVTAPGIYTLNNGGTSSLIEFIGVNQAWTEDGTLAIVDGADDAPSGFVNAAQRSYHAYRNIHVKSCTGAAWGHVQDFSYSFFTNCVASDSADGFGGAAKYMTRCSLVNCKAYNNTTYGFKLLYAPTVNCSAYNNGTYGFYNSSSPSINCVAFENPTYGFCLAGSSVLANCVMDKNDNGVYCGGGAESLVACRITNNTTYGVRDAYAARDPYCFYSGNGTNIENGRLDDTVNGESTRVTTGVVGYIDNDDATSNADRNYGLTNLAAARRQAVTL